MIGKFILALLLTAVVSYLLGSLNSAIIVVKLWKKQDIRDYGSKNAGLTNTYRVYGKGPAALTLVGDLSKGIVAVILSRLIFRLLQIGIDPTGALAVGVYPSVDTRFVGYIAGFFAILGHIFPLYYGFKGGKGVLVAASILIVIDPITFCIVIPFFILVLILTRYVSVASISAAIAYPIITGVSHALRGMPTVWLDVILVACTSVLLIYMHRSNIERLKNGTENKFGTKKK